MNVEHHGILLAGLEIRRLDEPALSLETVDRGEPQLLGLT